MSAQTIIALVAAFASAVLAFLLGLRSSNNDGRADLKRAREKLADAEHQAELGREQGAAAQAELGTIAEQLEQGAELADGAGSDLGEAADIAKRNENLIAELRKRRQQSKST